MLDIFDNFDEFEGIANGTMGISIAIFVIIFLIVAAIIVTVLITVFKHGSSLSKKVTDLTNKGMEVASQKLDNMLKKEDTHEDTYCEYCGASLDAGEKKCPHCGAKTSVKK